MWLFGPLNPSLWMRQCTCGWTQSFEVPFKCFDWDHLLLFHHFKWFSFDQIWLMTTVGALQEIGEGSDDIFVPLQTPPGVEPSTCTNIIMGWHCLHGFWNVNIYKFRFVAMLSLPNWTGWVTSGCRLYSVQCRVLVKSNIWLKKTPCMRQKYDDQCWYFQYKFKLWIRKLYYAENKKYTKCSNQASHWVITWQHRGFSAEVLPAQSTWSVKMITMKTMTHNTMLRWWLW